MQSQSSAPGPNKSAPDILKFLLRQLRIVWEKQFIPRAWCRTGGFLFQKRKSPWTLVLDDLSPKCRGEDFL